MAARDEQQRTRDDLRSKLAEPSLNQAASLKEKIPTVETRKRVATTQLEQLEEEWARVDAEAKKKYQTVEKAIEDHLKVLAWCAHRLAHRAHTVASLSFGFFFPQGEGRDTAGGGAGRFHQRARAPSGREEAGSRAGAARSRVSTRPRTVAVCVSDTPTFFPFWDFFLMGGDRWKSYNLLSFFFFSFDVC